MNLRHALRMVLQPRVILPVLLTAALLAVALSLGDLGKVLIRIQSIPIWVMAVALGMAIAYLAIKGWQLHILLNHLKLHPGFHRLVLAFSVGELAVTLPFGIFAQNWVLSATGGGESKFGRSSSATVVMLLVETVVVLLVLAVIGIPRWPQLRTVAAVFAFGLLLLVYLALRFGHLTERIHPRIHGKVLRKGLNQLEDLIQGLQTVYQPKLIAATLLSAVVYLAALTVAFMFVGRSVGIPHLGFLTAATIYAFSLAAILLAGGMLSQIGTVEVLGIGAAQAWGLSLTDGLALMLGFRIVWTGAIWLVNLPLMIVLWRTLKPAEKVKKLSADDFEKAAD
ncbi:MAG: flippase-like domain-containing protein [Gammaproteobacteria bacterium]|nr:flippase-like domain-containing protein [Gammaproteobacteria bacterium]